MPNRADGEPVCNDNWMQFTLRFVVDHKRRRAPRATSSNASFRLRQDRGRVKWASATFELVEARSG